MATFNDESELIWDADVDVAEGLIANNSGTSIKVDDDYAEDELNVPNLSSYGSSVITIDASERSSDLVIIGNSNANVITIGSANTTIDGGAGADKIYAGDGDDLILYTPGQGNDTVYNYNGENSDIISVSGVSTLDNSAFVNFGNGRAAIDLGTGTLNFGSTTTTFVLQYNDQTMEVDLTGLTFSANRQNVSIDSEYTSDIFDGSQYSRLVNIYGNEAPANISLIGNDNDNIISVAGNGAIMDGGAGKDKLYGNEGDDVFVYTVGTGSDTIYNYNSEDADDEVVLYGVTTLDNSNFLPVVGGNVYAEFGNDTLTFVNSKGTLNFSYNDGEQFAYNSTGMYFSADRRTVFLYGEYEEDSFDATNYSRLQTIQAVDNDKELELIGNSLDNVIYIGSGGGTLDGATGNDKLYGGADEDVFVHSLGAGNDTIFNYDGENDNVVLFGVDTLDASQVLNVGGRVYVDLGTETLNFSNVTGELNIDYGGSQPLVVNPNELIFNANRTAVQISDVYEDNSFDAGQYSALRTVSAGAREDALNITGNTLSNVIYGAIGGGTLDGGAGSDALYGNEGTDYFVHTVGAGSDTFFNYNAEDNDELIIYGVTGELTRANFLPVGSGTMLIDLGNDTLTIENYSGIIGGVYGNADPATAIESYDFTGITLAADRSSIAVDDNYDSSDLDVSEYGTSIATVNAARRTEPLNIVGTTLANDISIGSGGGSVDGGAGSDKLYGGNGADIFVYTIGGSGNDTIYKFDASNEDSADVIQLHGDTSGIDQSVFQIGTDGIVSINLGSNTLTLVKPSGDIRLIDEAETELATYNADGASLASDKFLAIGNDYKDEVVDAANYSSELESINAAAYSKGELSIIGNSNANEIRAGSGGTTLDGANGNDKLYGDQNQKAADYFVWTVGSGRDTIFNYSSTLEGAEDKVVLMGNYGDISEANFNEVGSNTTLTVDGNQLIFVNPRGSILLVDENDGEVYTHALPDGVSISNDRKTLIVTDAYGEDVIDASDYNDAVETVTARTRTAELEIIGNTLDNGLRAPSGGGTLDGGLGNDKLYGGDGADWFRYSVGGGNDSVYEFDSSDEDAPDVINISGIDSLSQSAIRLIGENNIQIEVGSGSLTLVNPRGAVTIVNDDGEELAKFDSSGSTVSSDSRTLYIDANYNDTIVDAVNFSTLIATINASTYPDPLYILGNSNANVIKAGPGGGTMDGAGYNDHLYGNDGRDVFRYTNGEGNDFVYNYNSTIENAGDVIQLIGVGSLTKSNFRDTSNGTTIIQVGTRTLTLVDPIGAITVFGDEMYDEYDELTEPMIVYGKSLPAGVSYNFNKTKLTVAEGAALDESEDGNFISIEGYSNNLRNVDASKYENEITVLGGSTANEIYAGTGGSSIDGAGGFDKLYGGTGADTFAYVMGEGNDYIYNYNSADEEAQDLVQIFGDISNLTKNSFRDSGRNTILTLGTNQLTFVSPTGSIIILDSNGDSVIAYDSTLESGVSYNENKTELTVGRDAELEDPTIDMETLSNNLRKINGTNYSGELYLIGNEKANELRAGSGGATMDGREGTDKYYGGDGVDVFIVSLGGGNDQIYNYNGDQGDSIQVLGNVNLNKSSFQDSNENTFLKLGNEKVMINNPTGAITLLDSDENEILTYGKSLPSGVQYADNKTRLVIGSTAELEDEESEMHVEDYVNNLRDIDASAYEGNVILLGDDRVNELRAGSGGSSLNGGLGNDKLYGGAGEDIFAYVAGEGNDLIYNYDGSSGDIVMLYGVNGIEREDFSDSNGNVILKIGSNNLTFVNPIGPIALQDEGGNDLNVTYEENLPSGLVYNTTRTKLTVGRINELADNVLDMETLSNNLRDIDASRYEYSINLLGNDKSNELRAGSGGSSLDGRAAADKLYGGSGADTYVVSVGGGNDQIYNYNGNEGDVIQVFGINSIRKSDFQDSGSNVMLNLGTERILINKPVGAIEVVIGDDLERFVYGSSLNGGVSYSTDKRTLTIGRNADLGDDNVFDMETLSNNIRNIDASEYAGEVVLIGNDKANELHAGEGGSTLDGGAGTDKLYGGAGNDVFVYSIGSGSDYIYNYDGENDVIQIMEDNFSLDESNFRDNGRNTIIKIGSNRLTLVNPSGHIVVTDIDGDTIATYNEPLPDGVEYNSNKTKLTIADDADLGSDNVFDMATLASNLKEIDASAYEGDVVLVGGSKADILRGSAGSSSLDGGLGNDQLYGGTGRDTFCYTAGEGSDYIYNFDGSDDENGDILQLFGVNSIDESNIRESGQNIIISIGSEQLTLVDAVGQLRIIDENELELLTYNENLPSGLTYNTGKTKLFVAANADLEEPALSVDNYVSTLRDIDASAYEGELALTGNDKANDLYAGTAGSTLDGGEGNDQLYGGAGADTFVYTYGEGNERIYNYDSTNEENADVVQLRGVTSVERSDFRDSGKNTILTIGSNRLTFVNPQGAIIVTDDGGNTLSTYGTTLPRGVSYNGSKTKLTIGANADLSEFGNEFDMETLSSNIKDIDGSAYGEELMLTGNSKTNVLRAGSGGSTLDGGAGADKLYGGSGADVFVHKDGDGNDHIYNYDGNQGDVIQLQDVGTISRNDFRDSGSNVILTLGTEKLTFVNPKGQITVIGEDGEELATYGENLPEGAVYSSDKTKLTIRDGAEFEDNTIDMNEFSNELITLDARQYTDELNITGNDKANEIYAGSGGGSLDGGEGSDKLYGGEGADVFVYNEGEGSDRIFNYGEGDTIRLVGVSDIDRSMFKDSGKNTVITVGSKKLTLVNPSGVIEVVVDGSEEAFTYGKELPDGVSYNSSKTRLTISANADLEENGNVFNIEDYSNNLKEINASKYGEEIELNGDDKANELRAGSGGSTLHGGLGNDKLYGGSGADVFVYSGGSDVIYNYTASEDQIALRDVRITSSRVSGNDIVYAFGTGSLTLKNAAIYGLTGITVVDEDDLGAEDEEQFASTSEQYWFEQDSATDELSEILSTDAAIDLNFDQLQETFKPSMNELTFAARKQSKE